MNKRLFIIPFLLLINLTWIYTQTLDGEWYFFCDYGKTLRLQINERGAAITDLDSVNNKYYTLKLGGFDPEDKIEIVKNGYVYLALRTYKEDYTVFKFKQLQNNDLEAYMFYGNGNAKRSALDSLVDSDTLYGFKTGELYTKASYNDLLKLKSIYEISEKDVKLYLYNLNLNILNFYNKIISDCNFSKEDEISHILECCRGDIFFETSFSNETLIELGYQPLITGSQFDYFSYVILDKYPNINSFYKIIYTLF